MFTGRIDRLGYFLGIFYWFSIIFLVCIAFFLLSIIFKDNPLDPIPSPLEIGFFIFLTIWFLLYPFLIIGISTRRLHDLNRSGSLSFILIVPLISYIYFVYLLFAKGDINSNQYGLPQSSRNLISLFFGQRNNDATSAATKPYATPITVTPLRPQELSSSNNPTPQITTDNSQDSSDKLQS